jgi:hypothetical protein
MYYEINVSLNGKHLFATAERSITNETKMEDIYNLFLEKFPENEGYKLDVTKWENVGKPIIFKNERVE